MHRLVPMSLDPVTVPLDAGSPSITSDEYFGRSCAEHERPKVTVVRNA